MTTDALKLTIFKEIMNLENNDVLQQVYSFIMCISEKKTIKEYTLPEDLLRDAAEYNERQLREGGTFYSTEEMDEIIKTEMKWK